MAITAPMNGMNAPDISSDVAMINNNTFIMFILYYRQQLISSDAVTTTSLHLICNDNIKM